MTGAAGSASHSAAVDLVVTAAGGGGGGLVNGGFESGSLAGWTPGGAISPTLVATPVHSGAHAARLGSGGAQQPRS